MLRCGFCLLLWHNLADVLATPRRYNGNSLPLRWHYFAIGLARSCHNLGTVVPPRWQSCAKPQKKFGTNGILLTGVLGRKKLLFLLVPRSIHVVVVRYFLIDFLCLLGRYFLYELSGYSSPDASWLDDSVA